MANGDTKKFLDGDTFYASTTRVNDITIQLAVAPELAEYYRQVLQEYAVDMRASVNEEEPVLVNGVLFTTFTVEKRYNWNCFQQDFPQLVELWKKRYVPPSVG